MLSHRIDEESGIIIVTGKGKVRRDDYFSYAKRVSKDVTPSKVVKTIYDYREAQLHFSTNTIALDLDEMAQLTKAKMAELEVRHLYSVSVVSDRQNQTITDLYKRLTRDIPNYSYRVLKDFDEAVEWLKSFPSE